LKKTSSLLLALLLAGLLNSPSDVHTQQAAERPQETQSGATTPLTKSDELVTVNVADGTPVEVELAATVSGQDMMIGDLVDFKVSLPVQVNGVIIIEKGAAAKARITTAKRSGHWGRAGKLEWAMQETVGVDGSRIPLRFTKRIVGDSKGGRVAAGAVATTVLIGPTGMLLGLKTGKPAVIPAGSRYSVFVNGNISVKGKTTAQSEAARTGAQ
jgi:hypothetical protein